MGGSLLTLVMLVTLHWIGLNTGKPYSVNPVYHGCLLSYMPCFLQNHLVSLYHCSPSWLVGLSVPLPNSPPNGNQPECIALLP